MEKENTNFYDARIVGVRSTKQFVGIKGGDFCLDII